MANVTTEDILHVALELSSEERARLARELLASLDDAEDDTDVEGAWTAEIARRARDVVEGRVPLVDGQAALERVKARLRRTT